LPLWRRLGLDRSEKTDTQLQDESRKKIEDMIDRGILRTPQLVRAFSRVSRHEFVPGEYRDRSYREISIPLPALEGTISRPSSYAVFYEALELGEGDRFLEIGTGSGYGVALAREAVGRGGRVVSIEIDRSALAFARSNLSRLGYQDVILIRGDGALGYQPEAPYDKISVTAAIPSVPQGLLDQLGDDGLLIAPIGPIHEQVLKLIRSDGSAETISKSASFVPMVGMYGSGR